MLRPPHSRRHDAAADGPGIPEARVNPALTFSIGLAILGTALITVSGLMYVAFKLSGWDDPIIAFFFPWFDAGFEANIPAFFGATLWVILSLIALCCGYMAPSYSLSWYALAAVAFIAALDEATMFHEQLSRISGLLEPYMPTSILSYSWVYAGILIAALVIGVFIPLALRLPRPVAGYLIAGGVVFLSGALGVETITGHVEAAIGASNWIIVLLIHVEEWFEYLGVTLAIYGLSRMVLVSRTATAISLDWRGYKVSPLTPRSHRTSST